MKSAQKEVTPPPPTECGHPAEYPRLMRVPRGDDLYTAWYLCPDCASLLAQMQAIPCIGCGGFDPRPGWPGQFNSPLGYYGGGFHAGQWFPWCFHCMMPLAVTCSSCMGNDGNSKHVCGEPVQLAPDAAENLWHRYKNGPLQYPSFGIEFRHLLGERDWSPGAEVEYNLPPAQSLWPSVEAAWEAIQPYLREHEARQLTAERLVAATLSVQQELLFDKEVA